MNIHCKKSFRGCIDIRDYIVQEAIEKEQSITVTCNDFEGESVYNTKQLMFPIRKDGPFKSKHGTKPYYLYVYKWKN